MDSISSDPCSLGLANRSPPEASACRHQSRTRPQLLLDVTHEVRHALLFLDKTMDGEVAESDVRAQHVMPQRRRPGQIGRNKLIIRPRLNSRDGRA